MPSKDIDLKQAVQKVSDRPPIAPELKIPHANQAPSRQGKKALVVYVDQEVGKELQRLAMEHGTSIQGMGIEAWNLVLEHYRSKGIA